MNLRQVADALKDVTSRLRFVAEAGEPARVMKIWADYSAAHRSLEDLRRNPNILTRALDDEFRRGFRAALCVMYIQSTLMREEELAGDGMTPSAARIEWEQNNVPISAHVEVVAETLEDMFNEYVEATLPAGVEGYFTSVARSD